MILSSATGARAAYPDLPHPTPSILCLLARVKFIISGGPGETQPRHSKSPYEDVTFDRDEPSEAVGTFIEGYLRSV